MRIKMENPEYITRKEAMTYFQNHKTIHVIFKKNNIEEVYMNNRYWYNKKQIEDLSNELNYRLSIRSNPIAKKYAKANDVSDEVKKSSYSLDDVAKIMGRTISHAHNILKKMDAPFQVGAIKKRWYPKVWVDANIKRRK